MLKEVIVREEQPDDIPAIREVNNLAFGQSQEASIIDALRENCPEIMSLVAIYHNKIIGHILFSPAEIKTEDRSITGMGLAPMCVLPEYQRRGVGSTLVRTGVFSLRARSCPFMIVLGYPQFYTRFGFEQAGTHHIQSEWDVPDEAFMIMIFDEVALRGVQGTARYRPEFAAAM